MTKSNSKNSIISGGQNKYIRELKHQENTELTLLKQELPQAKCEQDKSEIKRKINLVKAKYREKKKSVKYSLFGSG